MLKNVDLYIKYPSSSLSQKKKKNEKSGDMVTLRRVFGITLWNKKLEKC